MKIDEWRVRPEAVIAYRPSVNGESKLPTEVELSNGIHFFTKLTVEELDKLLEEQG
jgi:hypothetical protein